MAKIAKSEYPKIQQLALIEGARPAFQARAQEDCYIADGLSGVSLQAVLAETMTAFRQAQLADGASDRECLH